MAEVRAILKYASIFHTSLVAKLKSLLRRLHCETE